MAEFDPISIFFFLIKIFAAILAIVFFFVLYSGFSKEVVSNDLGSYSMEVSEIISDSPLFTTSKYVFDTAKLDAVNNKYVNIGHQCEFDYSASLQDLVTGDMWRFFGYSSDILTLSGKEVVIKNLFVAVNSSDDMKVHPARLLIFPYDRGFTRITCMVQRSFYQKEVLNLTLANCMKTDDDPSVCFSLRRNAANNDLACFYAISDDGLVRTVKWHDCRYLPVDIKFEDTYLKADPNNEGNKIITTYPLTVSPSSAEIDCTNIKNPDKMAYIAKKTDSVTTVMICMKEIK
ncbi:MAG: hypothetical protein NT120_02385 [Candidatus Aenigmarchaeota archaeon]|nr:hypothetical protein [Candidatus Aenigmarchaeota archaeon]